MQSTVITKTPSTGLGDAGHVTADDINNLRDAINSKADTSGEANSQNVQQALVDAASLVWDFSVGNCAIVTVAGNRTLNLSNVPTGGAGILMVTQDGTGSRTVALPSNSKTQAGFALSIGAGAIDQLFFYFDGVNYYWSITNNFTGSIPVVSDLLFQTVNNIAYNSDGEYWAEATGVSGWGNTGLSNQHLPANTDGWLQFYIADSVNNLAMVAFKVANTLTGYAGFSIALWVNIDTSGGLVHPCALDNGVNKDITTGDFNMPAIAIGSYVRLKRTSGVFTYETSTDAINWTFQYTFTYTSNVAMYIGTDINGTGRLNQPKFNGLI
jgi:hypothetical protein